VIQAKVQTRTGHLYDMTFGQHDTFDDRNGLTQVWLDEIVSLKTGRP